MVYHNCVSLCTLIKGKEETKSIYITLALINYRNYNQHVADYIFGSSRQFSVSFWLPQCWKWESEMF